MEVEVLKSDVGDLQGTIHYIIIILCNNTGCLNYSLATELYYLLDDVRCMTEHVIGDACPGIALQRHILSAKDMRAHRPMVS